MAVKRSLLLASVIFFFLRPAHYEFPSILKFGIAQINYSTWMLIIIMMLCRCQHRNDININQTMMDRPPHKQASRGESSASPRSRLLALLFVIIVSTCGSRSGLPLAAATSIACHPHGSVHTKRHQSPALTMTMSTFPRGGGIEGGASPSTPSSSSAKVKASTTPPPSPSAEIIAICRLVRRPFESFVNAVIDAKSHLVAAACGRALSIFGMYPVDTIKTRMQMGKPFVFDGLYRGVGGSLVGQVPYGVLTFGSYEMYKRYFLERFPNARPTLVYALSAILGDVTGSGWLCPSEVVKQQLQAGIYGNTMEAISGIWRGGGFGGFYRGYTGGLAR
jgi:hypothetical protein